VHVQRRVNVGMSVPVENPVLVASVDVQPFRGYASGRCSVLVSLLLTVRSALRSRAALHLEVLVALFLAGITSCSQPPAGPTPATSPPVPQSAPPGPSLTGVVFQKTEQGRRPIVGARIVVVDLLDGPYGNFPWYELASDINGHFSLVAFARRAVKITAYAGPGSGLWNQSGLFQVSAVHPIVDGATSVEVELVRHGAAYDTGVTGAFGRHF
jgi:hypothetical protein